MEYVRLETGGFWSAEADPSATKLGADQAAPAYSLCHLPSDGSPKYFNIALICQAIVGIPQSGRPPNSTPLCSRSWDLLLMALLDRQDHCNIADSLANTMRPCLQHFTVWRQKCIEWILDCRDRFAGVDDEDSIRCSWHPDSVAYSLTATEGDTDTACPSCYAGMHETRFPRNFGRPSMPDWILRRPAWLLQYFGEDVRRIDETPWLLEFCSLQFSDDNILLGPEPRGDWGNFDLQASAR